jgi:hypothetical protein
MALFFAARILACCISPDKSLAADLRCMVAEMLEKLGMAKAARNSIMATTTTISVRLKPPEAATPIERFVNFFIFSNHRR